MMCAWDKLLSILPPELREEVNRRGREQAREIRLRLGTAPELVLIKESVRLSGTVSQETLSYIVNAATRYSPWAGATAAQGYLTAPGGHRIGLCGDAVCREGVMKGIRTISSLCIRVARDFPGIGWEAAAYPGSLLILGPPGWGKTTLLRDVARERAKEGTVSVVDERGELFPAGFSRGEHMDVLIGCPKSTGIDTVLRTMGPSCIAVDEITENRDCEALLRAYGCGVCLLATAHASSLQDYRSRSVYRPLAENRVFDTLLFLHRDRSYHVERVSR